MSAHDDASDFGGSEYPSAPQAACPPAPDADTPLSAAPGRPPSREEIEALVSEKQIRLAELKRAQQELERERSGLEELRRRQMEFQTGRHEMLQHLVRGIGLLEEAEVSARRDAEQMARTLAEFREALDKVHAINDQTWTHDNFSMELTRALTIIENARMGWNAAQLKFPVLSGVVPGQPASPQPKAEAVSLANLGLLQLCKIGLTLTWPVVLVGLAIFIALLLRR